LKIIIFFLILAFSLFASFNPFFSDKFNEIKIEKKGDNKPLTSPISFVNRADNTQNIDKPIATVQKNDTQEPIGYAPLQIDFKIDYIGYLRVKSKPFALIRFNSNKMVIKRGDFVTMGKQQLLVSQIDDKKIILEKDDFKKIVYFSYKK
jgi:Tfp pilus assembly protein PilP